MAREGVAGAAAEQSTGPARTTQNVPAADFRKTRRSIFKGLQKVGKRFTEVPFRKPHNSEPSVGQKQNRPGKPGRFSFSNRFLKIEA
jgi:hypothetical protein